MNKDLVSGTQVVPQDKPPKLRPTATLLRWAILNRGDVFLNARWVKAQYNQLKLIEHLAGKGSLIVRVENCAYFCIPESRWVPATIGEYLVSYKESEVEEPSPKTCECLTVEDCRVFEFGPRDCVMFSDHISSRITNPSAKTTSP